MTLIQFDDVYEVVYSKDIQDVPELTQDTFVPRGSTALYDAQGKAIATLQEEISKLPKTERPNKVVFVTLTDGMNNASKEHTKESVAKLIQQMKDTYKWQFIYLGANQDAVSVGSSMNIPMGNTMTFGMANIGATMNSASASMRSLRSMPSTTYCKLTSNEVGEAIAFSDQDREDALSSGNFSGVTNTAYSNTAVVDSPNTGSPNKPDGENNG